MCAQILHTFTRVGCVLRVRVLLFSPESFTPYTFDYNVL